MTDIADKRNGIQVISRAAAVLRTLKDDPSGLSVTRIANRVGLPRSTVQRIVAALITERFVVGETEGGGLKLGPEFRSFANATRYDLVERCRSVMTDLTQATGETCDLAVLRGANMLFLEQLPGRHRLQPVSAVGQLFPLTTPSCGRACLALMPENLAIDLIESEWKRNNVKGDINAILAMLNSVRNEGLAYDLDDHTVGVSAISFAFRDWNDEYVSISVVVPTIRYHEAKGLIETELRKAKRKMSQMLGS